MATNNDDDLDTPDFENPEGDLGAFDDPKQKGSFGDVWRNNPLVKAGVVFAGFAAIVLGIIIFGGKAPKLAPSSLPGGSDVVEAPATSEVTKSYEKQVEDFNAQRVEEALKTGGSVLPVPVEPPLGRLDVPEEEEAGEDPLERWRRLQEERARQQAEVKQTASGGTKRDTRGEAVGALAQLMSGQMQSILESKSPGEPKKLDITPVSWLQDLAGSQEAKRKQEAQASEAAQGTGGDAALSILVPAGSVVYAQILTEANTDAPGPVLAQITSGPLAGSRLLGEFKATDEYLVLTFKTVVVDGVSQDIDAVGLDPDTTLTGLATDVDHRYWKKIVLPAAAAFVEGLASAISDSGTTSITIQGDSTSTTTDNSDKDRGQKVATGIEEAGKEVRDILEEEAEATKTLIRVRAGTPLGILFLEPVTDNKAPAP